jgi:hypothetical protein
MKIVISYIVAILVIGGAAYFSYDHSLKFKKQQEIRLATIEENRLTTNKAEATEKDLDDTKKALRIAQDEQAEATDSIRSLVTIQAQLKKNIVALDAEIAEQKGKQDNLEETIRIAIEEFKKAGLPGDITMDNINEKVKELDDSKKDLGRKQEELEALVAAAEKRLEGNQKEANRLTERKMERDERHSRNGMESVITAVEPGWGFVVIGAGSKTGFTPQTTLLVKRDGRLIGKVRPTAIEPTQTIADVIQDSMAPGVRLQPGDRVILAKPETR